MARLATAKNVVGGLREDRVAGGKVGEVDDELASSRDGQVPDAKGGVSLSHEEDVKRA